MKQAAHTPSSGRSSSRLQAPAEPERCSVCGHPVVAINMTVDGRPLEMRSCDNCDTRSWNLAGSPIGLHHVLDQVGQFVGKRRS